MATRWLLATFTMRSCLALTYDGVESVVRTLQEQDLTENNLLAASGECLSPKCLAKVFHGAQYWCRVLCS